jgi:hypothetical protein
MEATLRVEHRRPSFCALAFVGSHVVLRKANIRSGFCGTRSLARSRRVLGGFLAGSWHGVLCQASSRSVNLCPNSTPKSIKIGSKIYQKSIKMEPGIALGGLWGASRFQEGLQGAPESQNFDNFVGF